QLDLAALREYRDAVGRRTREIVGAFTAPDWEGATTTEAVQSAADQGGFGARAEMLVKVFSGRPRAALLSGIALFHCFGHMGAARRIDGSWKIGNCSATLRASRHSTSMSSGSSAMSAGSVAASSCSGSAS